jgi:hypothetical protein
MPNPSITSDLLVNDATLYSGVQKAKQALEEYASFAKQKIAGISEATAKAGGGLAGISSAGGLLTMGLGVVGASAGVSALVGQLDQMAAKYRESHEAAKRLDAVWAQSGASIGITKDDLNDLAESLSKTTNYSKTASTSAATLLASFGSIHGEQFTGALKVAQDLAATFGMELPQAAEMVGRSMAMPEMAARMLRQANIHLSDAVEENIKQLYSQGKTAQASQVILDELSKHVGGNAEKMASAGQIQAHAIEEMEIKAGEPWDRLGRQLKTGLGIMISWGYDGVSALRKLKEEYGDWIRGDHREMDEQVQRVRDSAHARYAATHAAAEQEKKDAAELAELIEKINRLRAMAGKGKMTAEESPHNATEGKDKLRDLTAANRKKFEDAIPKDMAEETAKNFQGWAAIASQIAKSGDEFLRFRDIARSLAAGFDVRSQADQFAEALKDKKDSLKGLGLSADQIKDKLEELREKWGMKDPEKGVENFSKRLQELNEKLAKKSSLSDGLSDAAKDRIRGALEKETFGGPTSPAGILEEKLRSLQHEREAIDNNPAYLNRTSDAGQAAQDHDRLAAENDRKRRAAMEEAGGGILTPLEKEQAAIRALNDKMATGIPSAQAYADELKRIKDATLSESGAGAWLDKLDPLRHYGEELAKINRLEKDRLLTQQQATEARNQSYKDILSSSGAQGWLDKIATPADKVAKQFAEIAKLRKEGLLTGGQYDQSAMAIMKDANPAQKPHEFHAAIEDLSSFNARIMGAHASKGDPAEVAKQQHLEAKRGADGIWRLVDMLGHGGGQSRGQERVAQIRQSQGARVAAAASINPFQFGY